MHRRLNKSFLFALIAGGMVLASAAPARADFARRLYRGLTFALSPSVGQLQNGPFADQNVFRQRYLRNIPGDGVGYEVTRLWGTDTFGNASQFDAGIADVALQGATHARFLYNRRLIPEINVQLDTNGAPLNYNFSTFTGVQNLQMTGAFTGTVIGTLNILGFYSLQVSAQNANSNLRLDGVLVTDNRSTDFDVGPINVVGNIWIDLASNTLQALGQVVGATLANVGSSAAAPREKIPDGTDISIDDIENAAALTPEIEEQMVNALIQSLLSSALPQELNALLGLPGDTQYEAHDVQILTAPVPEPTTAALFGLPALLMLVRRGRR